MDQKKKKVIIIVCAAVLAALIAAFVVIFVVARPSAQAGSKAYTFTVVDDQSNEKVYTGKTDAEYLSGIMDELAAEGDFSYEGETGEFGLTIYTVNGLNADYNTGNAYWAVYVNGDYGLYGADQQPVADGDSYMLKYETF